jgi:mRNA interferase HigB
MILVGEVSLRAAARPDAMPWVQSWIVAVRSSQWRNLIEVRSVYPSADGVRMSTGQVVTVFNVAGNKYRMLTLVDYPSQIVQYRALLTHAEYSKGRWKW